ncbi:MAG: hypothetical protein IPF54_00540 [Draconibacterium sp.]|nr:hypothetical protein [Draconibacterium sp.]
MKTALIKTVDSISVQTETKLSKIKKSKNRYFNNSIDANKCQQKRVILEKILERESELVKTDSMDELLDFEKIDFAD